MKKLLTMVTVLASVMASNVKAQVATAELGSLVCQVTAGVTINSFNREIVIDQQMGTIKRKIPSSLGAPTAFTVNNVQVVVLVNKLISSNSVKAEIRSLDVTVSDDALPKLTFGRNSGFLYTPSKESQQKRFGLTCKIETSANLN